MAISQIAQRNHDQLFPDHQSTLKITDPELVELFDNWAFDEVIEDAPLDVRLRLLVQLASLIACQGIGEYSVMLGAALNVGVTPGEVRELVYQAVPYVGLGKVFDFLNATNTVFRSRNIALPLEEQSTTTPATRLSQGLAVQKRLLGEKIDQMYAQSPRDLLHIQRYLSGNCFGDYLTRGGPDLATLPGLHVRESLGVSSP
jgi:4-carboxymuconolactone decarboxylase